MLVEEGALAPISGKATPVTAFSTSFSQTHYGVSPSLPSFSIEQFLFVPLNRGFVDGRSLDRRVSV
jgi:hypothetical protein